MLIREKDKQALQHIFARLKLPIEIWAYGSRVKGTAHEASDIDLVIRTSDLQPLPIEIYMQLVEDIKESNIPVLIELRDWARLPENFHHQILQQYEVLYSNLDK
jgi:predicted nucleotidyltransferase